VWLPAAAERLAVGRQALTRRAGVHRSGPGVTGQAELAGPLERPAGYDRLARRMPGRVVVQAALGRALGVTTRPSGDVHREHQRVGVRQEAHQQIPQPLGVDPAARQRGIAAAPAASVGWFQAQVRQGRDRPLSAQQRIGQVHQRIGAAGAAGVQPSAEGLQARQGCWRVGVGGQPGWVHTQRCGHRRLLRDLLLFCPKDHTVAASGHQPPAPQPRSLGPGLKRKLGRRRFGSLSVVLGSGRRFGAGHFIR
jgi:hypothetical protein